VANWEFLRTSISDTFNNQLWGAQVTGADICGFASNTTDELCARWYQLGSFYPFSRNHNEKSAISQEPYALGDLTMRSATSNLKFRYAFLKYIYTLYVSKKGLGVIWKPLFFAFPNDARCYEDEIVETQFMLGPDVLITPLLGEGEFDRQAYFPQGNWYDIHKGYLFEAGTQTVVNFPEERVPLFIKEGAIVFLQDTVSVTKTIELDNVFIFYAGFKFDSSKSNTTTRVHRATGTIMSI
jgi:alpha-glucosidase (family GH31 glycosyl hydrolase)